MRKRILLGFTVVIVLLIALLIVTPFIFKDRINTAIKEEINTQFNAKIDYGDFTISLFRSFPNFTLSLDNLSIIGVEEFKGDTLAFIKQLNLAIDLRSVIKGNTYKILAVSIDGPHVNLLLDTNGKTNWDILKSSTSNGGGEAPPSFFSTDINKLNVENATVNYNDKSTNSTLQLHKLGFEGTGSITSDYYDVQVKTKPVNCFYQSGAMNPDSLSALLDFTAHVKIQKRDIEQKNYEAIETSGNADIIHLQYTGYEIPKSIFVTGSQMFFTQKVISLDNVNAVISKNNVTIKGKLDNYIPYLLDKGDLAGLLDIRSPNIDLTELAEKNKAVPPINTTGATNPPVPSKANYFKVPAHINVTANLTFGKVLHDKLLLENVKGQLILKDEAIVLDNITAGLLGGYANFSLKYDTKKPGQPVIAFSCNAQNLDVQKTYIDMNVPAKIVPGIKYTRGSFSANFTCSGKLKPGMAIDDNSLVGNGKIDIPDAKVVGLPVLENIAQLAKIPSLQNLELTNASIVLKVGNGRVNIAPTDLKFTNGYIIHLEGWHGFDKTLNYVMQLDAPTKDLGVAASAAQHFLSQIPGLNMKLPEKMGFRFKITGTAPDPKVKLVGVIPGGG